MTAVLAKKRKSLDSNRKLAVVGTTNVASKNTVASTVQLAAVCKKEEAVFIPDNLSNTTASCKG